MLAMARLDNPDGSPFMVGEKQIAWLKKDLEKVPKDTPIILFSHSPIQKINEMMIHLAHYGGWPVGVNGLRIAREVFDSIDSEGKA